MEPILPEGWPRPKGYSNGLRVPAGRELVAVSGMIGWDAAQRLVSPDFAPQFEQALRNVVAVVEAAGGAPSDLVRVTVYVTRLEDYRASLARVGESWRAVVGKVYPAMTLVQVAGLLEPGALVEIEATAAVPASR